MRRIPYEPGVESNSLLMPSQQTLHELLDEWSNSGSGSGERSVITFWKCIRTRQAVSGGSTQGPAFLCKIIEKNMEVTQHKVHLLTDLFQDLSSNLTHFS